MNTRASGILMHITSLPSAFGIGDLGPGAYAFADFLKKAGQRYWQVLPLNPTNAVNGNSPYSSISAFAANTALISPELMRDAGWLTQHDLDTFAALPDDAVAYVAVYDAKETLFSRAYENFKRNAYKDEYAAFCRDNASWLEDFSAFIVFKEHFHEVVWSDWPAPVRDRQAEALNDLKGQCHERIEKEKFLQFVFFKQWRMLKAYCNQNDIVLVGDIPIYVTYDSADAWAYPLLFKLTPGKKLAYLAGVPPDYFSKTGQLWGNPVYDWDALKAQGYAWWLERIEHNTRLFDCMRIDHFRGFVDYWQVPSGELTAVNGTWQKAPAVDFFTTVLARFPKLSIIAEDLGIITDEVREVMRSFKFPGMKIILFAFGEDFPEHPYLPHNYTRNCVAYTGTHDNNTVKGWYKAEATEEDKNRFYEYQGHKSTAAHLHWDFVRLVMNSVAATAIIPMQDVLGLGEKGRMNIPGIAEGNWQWRLLPDAISDGITAKLFALAYRYGRVKKRK